MLVIVVHRVDGLLDSQFMSVEERVKVDSFWSRSGSRVFIVGYRYGYRSSVGEG